MMGNKIKPSHRFNFDDVTEGRRIKLVHCCVKADPCDVDLCYDLCDYYYFTTPDKGALSRLLARPNSQSYLCWQEIWCGTDAALSQLVPRMDELPKSDECEPIRSDCVGYVCLDCDYAAPICKARDLMKKDDPLYFRTPVVARTQQLSDLDFASFYYTALHLYYRTKLEPHLQKETGLRPIDVKVSLTRDELDFASLFFSHATSEMKAAYDKPPKRKEFLDWEFHQREIDGVKNAQADQRFTRDLHTFHFAMPPKLV